MTSFFPTDAIRSRLEWNATLNPAAAPQTTEATKFLRKVNTTQHSNMVFVSDLLSRRPLLQRLVSGKSILSSRCEAE
jgi:hypothetical protein